MRRRKKKRLLFIFSIVIAFLILGTNMKNEKPHDAVATEVVSNEDVFGKNPGNLKDGVYRASNQGFIDYITVELVVRNGSISEFKVVEHNETTQIAETAMTDLTYEILKNHSPKVDVISGATETSQAIIKGARDTIRQAGGNPDDF